MKLGCRTVSCPRVNSADSIKLLASVWSHLFNFMAIMVRGQHCDAILELRIKITESTEMDPIGKEIQPLQCTTEVQIFQIQKSSKHTWLVRNQNHSFFFLIDGNIAFRNALP